MEQRRKIIIPTGTDPEETLSTPHFDAEATLSAQPVVPLAEPVVRSSQNAYAVGGGAAYAPRAAAPQWKRSTLIFIILAAVSVGIASGLAIGLYQSRTKAPATVIEQPSVSEPQQAARQPEPEPAQPPPVKQPEQQPQAEAQIPATTPDKETKSKPSNDSADEDKPKKRNNPERDDTRVPPAVVRDRPTVTVPIIDERDDRAARQEERRERRKEERREERRRQREENDGGPISIPRSVERARQDINRIRDIFEGRQP